MSESDHEACDADFKELHAQLAAMTKRAEEAEAMACSDGECGKCTFCTDAVVAWNDQLRAANARAEAAEANALHERMSRFAEVAGLHAAITRLETALRELLGHWEIAAVSHDMGKVHVLSMGSEPLVNARRALSTEEET